MPNLKADLSKKEKELDQVYPVGKFPLNKLFKLNTADFSAAMVLMLKIEMHMVAVIFLFAANLIGKLGQQKAGQTDKRHDIFQQLLRDSRAAAMPSSSCSVGRC